MGTGWRRQLVAGLMKSKKLDYQTAGRASQQLPDADRAQGVQKGGQYGSLIRAVGSDRRRQALQARREGS